jgi:hypothetical protein
MQYKIILYHVTSSCRRPVTVHLTFYYYLGENVVSGVVMINFTKSHQYRLYPPGTVHKYRLYLQVQYHHVFTRHRRPDMNKWYGTVLYSTVLYFTNRIQIRVLDRMKNLLSVLRKMTLLLQTTQQFQCRSSARQSWH